MEKYNKKGYMQGDMKPEVDDYQLPSSNFSQDNLGKTLNYIERQDRIQKSNTSSIKNKAYKGRYS